MNLTFNALYGLLRFNDYIKILDDKSNLLYEGKKCDVLDLGKKKIDYFNFFPVCQIQHRNDCIAIILKRF